MCPFEIHNHITSKQNILYKTMQVIGSHPNAQKNSYLSHVFLNTFYTDNRTIIVQNNINMF